MPTAIAAAIPRKNSVKVTRMSCSRSPCATMAIAVSTTVTGLLMKRAGSAPVDTPSCQSTTIMTMPLALQSRCSSDGRPSCARATAGGRGAFGGGAVSESLTSTAPLPKLTPALDRPAGRRGNIPERANGATKALISTIGDRVCVCTCRKLRKFHQWTFLSRTYHVLLRGFFVGRRMTQAETLAKITVVMLELPSLGVSQVSSFNHTTGEALDVDSRVYEARSVSRRCGAIGRDVVRRGACSRRREGSHRLELGRFNIWPAVLRTREGLFQKTWARR